MNIEAIREYALQLEEAREGFAFGDNVIVFKVNEMIFLLLPLDEFPVQFNVKCEPERAIELREEYPDAIFPGYHMNKKHWNTVIVNDSLSTKFIIQMIKDSYLLVNKKKKPEIRKKK